MSDKRHVFISYSRKDKEFVERLCDDLENAKVPFWIDKEDIPLGTPDWERAIKDAIEAAKLVLWIVTPDSAVSRYVLMDKSVRLLTMGLSPLS